MAEPRYYVMGQADAGRRLFLIFAIRKQRICVISAVDMSAKEGRTYHEQFKTKTDFQK